MPRFFEPKPYDLVIIGASFTGLICARTAAMRGLRVAVLEAKADPGARIHTTGILVKEAADEIDLPFHLTRRVHGVRIYAPNLKSVDLFAPGYYFLTTDTAETLRWLAREAERAGASIICNTRFKAAERDGDIVRIAGTAITARFLVGADGARSNVAKYFGLDENRKFLTGVEIEYDGLDDVDHRFLHCFIDSDLAPGYLAWTVPGPKVTQVGLAVSGNNKPDLGRFVSHTKHLFQYENARVVERRSGLIPCGGPLKKIACPGVLLIGDAAGLVSPMTGGGIRLAFRSGRRAAQVVSDHLLDLGPSPETILTREMPRFFVKKILRRALDTAPPNTLINLGLTTPPIMALARRIYFHRRGAGHAQFEDFEKLIAKMADMENRPRAGARI